MMFVLKKVVGLVTDPVLVGLVLLLVGIVLLVLRREREWRGRLLVAVAGALLIGAGMWPVANMLVVPLEDDYAPIEAIEDVPAVRYVAVLGGGHAMVPDRPPLQWLSHTAVERLAEAVRLFHALEDPHLIVSGWAGKSTMPHAAVVAAAAASLGVPDDRISALPDPRDTAEELSAIARLVGDEPFLLVTSASHMPRAMATAERRGLKAIPAPTDFRSRTTRGFWSWVPDPGAMDVTAAAVHEYVGWLGYRLLDR
jgi:uncharacterized SAM-binding protein YcdF (DUF218 family)